MNHKIYKSDLTPEGNRFLSAINHLNNSMQLDQHTSLLEPTQFARTFYEELSQNHGGTILPLNMVQDSIIPITGKENIPVRIYKKQNERASPAILFFHGGGWSRGSLNTHDALCRNLANITDYTIISVAYSLAPEKSYPVPMDEAFAVYNHLLAHPTSYNILPNNIILSGDSAGGNIATGLVERLINNNILLPQSLALFYPALDLRTNTQNNNPYSEGYFLTTTQTNVYTNLYLNNNKEMQYLPEVSPILSQNLDQFPPVFIVSAECDILYQQASIFAQELRLKQKRVEIYLVQGVLHAFAQFFGLYHQAHEAVTWINNKIR